MCVWKDLSERMLRENTLGNDVFLAERTTPDCLKSMFHSGKAVALGWQGRIIVFAGLWETGKPEWLELGSLWVDPEHRGNDLSTVAYLLRLQLIPPNVRGFVVTHNPRAAHLALKHGFKEASREEWFSAAPFDIVCGPCDRDVGEKSTCPLRAVHSECRLLVR